VDLAEPAILWTRWATLATALSAVGFDDVWTVGPDGGHHDDHGGNWSHLALIEGGRAVLYGYDHEYSDTAQADPPIDLLAGAPDWLPWDDLIRYAAEDQLGYVHWHDGTTWSRVDYPDTIKDGCTATTGPVLTVDATLDELAGFVFEWGEHEPDDATERAAVRTAAESLLVAAGRGQLDAAVLTAYPCRSPEAGPAVAAAGGLTAGHRPPITPAGRRPATRMIRRLSSRGHDRLIWDAMRTGTELGRPEPARSPALDDLVTWVRAHAPAGDGRGSLLFYVDDSSGSEQSGEHAPADTGIKSFREAYDLVKKVRAEEADERYGRWLFLRVETTATGAAVDRRYDSWPPWWKDNGHSGPWRDNLRTELDQRAAEWRPQWSALLDPGVAYREI
jgi:hypothetical protein